MNAELHNFFLPVQPEGSSQSIISYNEISSKSGGISIAQIKADKAA